MTDGRDVPGLPVNSESGPTRDTTLHHSPNLAVRGASVRSPESGPHDLVDRFGVPLDPETPLSTVVPVRTQFRKNKVKERLN